ncbi:MAG: type 4a pilus biogenesis protein PilO [Candidatus Zixiibacteriota bacterium]|nr:MAG: type 4a pilus biogenesis protein PilO [candidate division Zixibacteria bacterium]
MDLKDSKTQKIALGVLAFFIVVYFWYTRVYTDISEQLTVKTQELETISTNLKNVELKAKSLEALKIEYDELLERYQEIEQLLPEVKQIPSFLVQLHTASSITGTKITRVHPLPIKSQEFYNIAEFDIEVTGTYHDFGTFISYVANFPFIANVSAVKVNAVDVAIKKSDNDKEGGLNELRKRETITAQFKLATYFVKEEERLRELVL